MRIPGRSRAECLLAALTILSMGFWTGSAHAQGVIIHLISEDGSFYSIPPDAGGWTFDLSTCFDFRIEDIEAPCDGTNNFAVLYFGDTGTSCADPMDFPDPFAPCHYQGLPGGSAFTTAIDLRDFAAGTPISFYPAYALRTDGSGADRFEIWARVNLEGEVFQKIASNIDPTVVQLFDFGVETIEPIILPSNAAGNEVNIQFLAAPDGVVGPVSGPTGFSVGAIEFVGRAAADAEDGEDTTAADEWFIPNSGSPSQGWNQVTAGATPLNPGSTGFYFGNPATDDYCDREDRPSSIFAGPVDLTALNDTVVLTITYAFQTDDDPAEDLAEIAVNIGNTSTFTTIASSDPAAGVPLLQNDGLQHVLQLNLPAGAGGDFANLRVSFTPDEDGTCGTGIFIGQTFSLVGGDGTTPDDGGDGDGGGGGGGGSCFIATAAYGTPVAKDIDVLRDVRDEYLMNSSLGLAFVDAYYRMAPSLADDVAQNPMLAAAVRVALVPVVLFSNLLLQSPLLTGTLFLLLGAVFVTKRRRAYANQ